MENNSSFSDVLTGSWNLQRTDAFMSKWLYVAYGMCAVYILAVFEGQKRMATRKALELDVVLAVWNFMFSLFSGVAAFYLVPELLSVIFNDSFIGSYCNNHTYYTDPVTGFWGWMFVMSKAPELGDTAFLVLRKRPVIFMHWYHHALTFVYAQLTYSEHQAWARWSLALNLVVHTIMYFLCGLKFRKGSEREKYTKIGYFGIRALKISTPRPVAKFITTIQIAQFVISCYIFTHLVFIKSYNSIPGCQVSWNVLIIGGLMYLSYLYLFAAFFYNSYIKKSTHKKVEKKE